jgi:hypothetical protein
MVEGLEEILAPALVARVPEARLEHRAGRGSLACVDGLGSRPRRGGPAPAPARRPVPRPDPVRPAPLWAVAPFPRPCASVGLPGRLE